MQKKRNFLHSKLALLLFLIFFLVSVGIGVRTFFQVVEAKRHVAQLEQRNTELEKTVQKLEEDIQSAEDPFFREQIMRNELSLQKPEELVLGAFQEKDRQQEQTPEGQEKKNFIEKLIEAVRGIFSR